MPLYEYQCPACSCISTAMRRLADYQAPGPECCGVPTRRIISLPQLKVVRFEAYQSPVSGEIISSMEARDRDMKKHNCRPWRGMKEEKAEAARVRQYQAQEQEKQIEAAVIGAYQAMPEEKRASLQRFVPGAPENAKVGPLDTPNARVYE